MKAWLKILSAASVAAALVSLLILFLHRWCRCGCFRRRVRTRDAENQMTRTEAQQSGIAGLHTSHSNQEDPPSERRRSKKPGHCAPFRWADHPLLVSEAVENGWTRFAFAPLFPSLPRSRSMWEFFAACDYGGDEGVAAGGEAEMSWEVESGSADFMQKIRLRPRSRSSSRSDSPGFSCVRMELPLPGPPLGNSSFPREAYFEITILSGEDEAEEVPGGKRNSMGEGEQVKLISDMGMKIHSDSLVHAASIGEEKCGSKKRVGDESRDDGDGSPPLISLGLTGGGPSPPKLPGRYPGSIGFNSNGSIYLDGLKLVFETEEGQWRGNNRVIGCGFDPGRKRVFFTVDSKLALAIDCKPEEFGSPLYPTLASTADVTVLVNMGQTHFKYAPANLFRTSNPCFFRPLPDVASPALRMGCEEDSQELFSMGRIDSKWMASRKENRFGSDESAYADSGLDSEFDDMFEIVLDDRSSKSRSRDLPV